MTALAYALPANESDTKVLRRVGGHTLAAHWRESCIS